MHRLVAEWGGGPELHLTHVCLGPCAFCTCMSRFGFNIFSGSWLASSWTWGPLLG